MEYLSLDVLIQRVPDGLSARVISSPAGEAAVGFSLPAGLDTVATSAAQWSSEAVRDAGVALFEAVFAGELLACYRTSYAEARRQGAGLRLRFRLGNAPDLAWVPWEFLHDPQRGFLAHFADTTIVRYLELPETAPPPVLKPPLRILAVFSNPEDDVNYDPIDVERERKALRQVLGPLEEKEQVTIDHLEDARLEVLQERLQTSPFQVLHYVGHGGVDASGEEGLVVLESSGGRGLPVSAAVFSKLLADRGLRLVFLNSCETARAGRRGVFSGVAQALVQAGVPAVVAMQSPIRDDAASALIAAFYRELALGSPVDTALAEARKSVSQLGGTSWAAPVVFLRAKEGRIFAPPRPPLRKRLLRAAPAALLTLNLLLLMGAIKRVAFYFETPREYFTSFVGSAQVVLTLLVLLVPDNWREVVLRPFRRLDGGPRPLPALASLLVSGVLGGTLIVAGPRVELTHVEGSIRPAPGEAELEIPQLWNVVSQRKLCGITSPPCQEPLPATGYLRLRYLLGRNKLSRYRISLTLEPGASLGFAHLRTDPAFDLRGAADRVGSVGTSEVWVVSPAEEDHGGLTDTVEVRLVGRWLQPRSGSPSVPASDAEEPRLQALFAKDREGKEVVSGLKKCWSLRDGAPVACDAPAAASRD